MEPKCGAQGFMLLDGLFFGQADGLFGQWYPAEGDHPATAAVVVSTGFHQHSAMYVAFAARLASEGFAVLCYDHRGFGRSKNYDGEERSQISAWEDLSDDPVPSCAGDLSAAVAKAEELLGFSAPVFVFGHSLGGLAAGLLGTSGAAHNKVAGFILSNPTLQMHGRGTPEEAAAGLPLNAAARAVEEANTARDKNKVVFGVDLDTASSNKEFTEFWRSEGV